MVVSEVDKRGCVISSTQWNAVFPAPVSTREPTYVIRVKNCQVVAFLRT